MEGAAHATSGDPGPRDSSTAPGRFVQSTILVIEDDLDIRELLTALFDMAGFGVIACDTAECGLEALRERTFDLVLTDYALPRHSGVWLLQNAEAEGLIQGTPVLIVTAHPNVEGADGYEVIQKPFDLDELVERVRDKVEEQGPRRAPTVVPSRSQKGDQSGLIPDCPNPVELILYVSVRSPRSLAAVENIQKLLERFHWSRVQLTVCDVPADPDAIAFTPALVRKTHGPRTIILGHITNPEIVMELLADCEQS
jgi:CheY-like chemotaxis protein